MGRRTIRPDEWQYRERTSSEVRGTLIQLVLEFVLAARTLPGVSRVALVGSLATEKDRPKDADVLVTIVEEGNLNALARLGRRLKGRAQGINSGADVFLATSDGQYLGRVCHYSECHRRVACRARHCGVRSHLNDDLDVLTLPPALVVAPPILLFPTVSAAVVVPADVEASLLAALRADS